MTEPNPMAVIVGGIRWVPFDVEFDSDGSTYAVEIFAIDMAHAMMRLDDLKATGRVKGEILGRFPA